MNVKTTKFTVEGKTKLVYTNAEIIKLLKRPGVRGFGTVKYGPDNQDVVVVKVVKKDLIGYLEDWADPDAVSKAWVDQDETKVCF